MGLINILFNKNKTFWLHVWGRSDISKELKAAILDFFIPDNIDISKYEHNERASEKMLSIYGNVENGYSELGEQLVPIIPTPSFRQYFYKDAKLPEMMPEWFCLAYPDVFVWLAVEGRIDDYNEILEDEDALVHGVIRYSILRTFIKDFKRGHTLECSCK